MSRYRHERPRMYSNYLDKQPRSDKHDKKTKDVREVNEDSDRSWRTHRGEASSSRSHKHDNHLPSNRSHPDTKRLRSIRSELREMMQIEHHHIIFQEDKRDGIPKFLDWCPQYLDPNIKGHMRGGRQEFHHLCRQCRRLCLHLLGKPGQRRICLGCAGYHKDDIPRWYYHDQRCRHCKRR